MVNFNEKGFLIYESKIMNFNVNIAFLTLN